MIYSSRLLKHPQLRLPSMPKVFSWNVITQDDGTPYLVLESSEGVFASQVLTHPEVNDESEYIARVSRAAMSLRWELDTQLELEAQAIAERESRKA